MGGVLVLELISPAVEPGQSVDPGQPREQVGNKVAQHRVGCNIVFGGFALVEWWILEFENIQNNSSLKQTKIDFITKVKSMKGCCQLVVEWGFTLCFTLS